jgi:hypothetical protein
LALNRKRKHFRQTGKTLSYKAAVNGGGPDSRLLAAELIIRGVPIIEIDYQHGHKARNLVLIEFAYEIR